MDKIIYRYYLSLLDIRGKIMPSKRFLIEGNICGDRVRIGRAIHKPPLTQEELSRKINFLGMEMTPLIISRIEKNQRHVCDGELRILAKALGVTMEWLCSEDEEIEL